MKRMHLIVSGRVQGVCFRMYTAEKARRLGLKGWVRNRPDGTVEVVAEGEQAPLGALAAWCRRGPPAARVADVRKIFEEATETFDSFRVAY